MKFSIKDFLSKCDPIRSFQMIWSHLLKKSLMENFIFVQWVNVLSWQIRFYWFELAAIHITCSENVYSLSSENIQVQG